MHFPLRFLFSGYLMIFNLKFVVGGSIDTFLEKICLLDPGPESKKFFLLKIRKIGNSILDPGPETKFFLVQNKKKRNLKEFFGGIRLPNNLSVRPGIGFNT